MTRINLEEKHIIITGGAGYLATNLVSQLKETNCSITRFDRPDAKFTPIKGKALIRDIEGDIRDSNVWEALLPDIDIVFHFAAQTSVIVAEQSPLTLIWKLTWYPFCTFWKPVAKKGMCPTILFSGTVTEVGLQKSLPVNENQPDSPITMYDLHKWVAENYLRYYMGKGIVRGAVLRSANVYGPGPKSSNADRGVLNMMIYKALHGEALTIYGDGNYLRDYIYIEDVVHAFLDATVEIERVNGQYFVIGSGQRHTIAEAINCVADRVELKTGNGCRWCTSLILSLFR